MSSTAKAGKRNKATTRPITSKRDYERALSVTQRLLAHPNRDTEEEKRLKALLEEMDRYEEFEEDADDDFADDSLYTGPRRRWSDEGGYE
jgi:recombination DNA repair RAD52 pathway protein